MSLKNVTTSMFLSTSLMVIAEEPIKIEEKQDLGTSGVSVTIDDAEGFIVYSAASPDASTTHTFYHYGLESGETYSIVVDIAGDEF